MAAVKEIRSVCINLKEVRVLDSRTKWQDLAMQLSEIIHKDTKAVVTLLELANRPASANP